MGDRGREWPVPRPILTAVTAALTPVSVILTTVRAALTPVKVILTTVRAALTPVKVILTTVRAALTPVNVILTTVRTALTPVNVILTTVRAALTPVKVIPTTVRTALTPVNVILTTVTERDHSKYPVTSSAMFTVAPAGMMASRTNVPEPFAGNTRTRLFERTVPAEKLIAVAIGEGVPPG